MLGLRSPCGRDLPEPQVLHLQRWWCCWLPRAVSLCASVAFSLKHRAIIIEESQLAGLDWGGSCKPTAQESSQLKIHLFVWLRA